MRVGSLTILVACILTGCVQPLPLPDWQLGRYRFNYIEEGGSGSNLVQVFDDGESTYLHFLNSNDPKYFEIRSGTKKLSPDRYANYVRVKGLYETLTVKPLKDPQRGKLRAQPINIYRVELINAPKQLSEITAY